MPLQLVREGVVFERLLLGQTQRKVCIIHNTSLLPVKWRLAGAEALPQEFKLLPSSGEIPARQQIPVTVEFTAFQKRDLSERVTLQVQDTPFFCSPVMAAHSVSSYSSSAEYAWPASMNGALASAPTHPRSWYACVKGMLKQCTSDYYHMVCTMICNIDMLKCAMCNKVSAS